MSRYREVAYEDVLMADGGVHRRYADGRREWRWRQPDGRVAFRDASGGQGTDEALGRKIIKRVHNGRVLYGRDVGYGRTTWGDGILTVNRSRFDGRVGAIIAAAGAGLLLGPLIDPPQSLTPAEEEELRQQAARDSGGSGGDGGGDSGGDGGSDDDWDDSGFDDDGDFG